MSPGRLDDISEQALQELSRQELTIVILTFNEETTLRTCIENLPPGLEVVVIDSGSQDATIEVAQEAGARVLVNAWHGFAAQRNFALTQLPPLGWRLFVDADEIYPSAFYEWVATELAESSADVYEVPTILVFEGRRLRHAPGYPIYHPRLVRSHVVFSNSASGHGETIKKGFTVKRAPKGYDHHFMVHGLKVWLTKHIRLAEMEANAVASDGVITLRRRLGSLGGRSLLRAPARFAYHYIIRLGFLDGRPGFKYSMLYYWYELTKWLLHR